MQPNRKNNNGANLRQIALWVLAFTLLLVMYQRMQTGTQVTELAYSDFKQRVHNGDIKSAVIAPDSISGELKEGEKTVHYKTVPVNDTKLVEELEKAGVEFKSSPDRSWLTGLLVNLGWIAMFFFLWWLFFIRQVQSGGKQAMAFGKTKARLQDPKKQKITYADVAGCDEAKEDLVDVVEFLKDPKKFQRLGAVLPKGILLYGPPGTGKTLLAKATAGEAGVPFFTASASEFVEMFVGVGASRVRDLFEQAKKEAPAIIFIDELDAVGRHRFSGIGGGHDEREQTLNQLLVELDGFEPKDNIVLIGATNRPDVLDPALLRPGRFDKRIVVSAPDLKGRTEILKVHAKKIKLVENADLSVIARGTPGFVGADLANVVNEAAFQAAKHNKKHVEPADMKEAIERIIAGPQRRSRIISESEKKIVAYHESGHALVAKLTPGSDPVHKVSIVPRGPALGYTLQLPMEDKYLTTKTELLNRIAVLLGGRAAESLVFNEITTGAHDDLSKVTDLAQRMVTEFGMSESMGLVSLKKDEREVFLGRDLMHQPRYSDQTANKIDHEVNAIIQSGYNSVLALLRSHRQVLDTMAVRLIESEVLESEEIDRIINPQAEPAPAAQPEPAAQP
ncbi:MAG: ATP-dependent metallopeptidase FtsH/Yme1/Tma family protein [Elusimicrobia bacterium]|nr:ATP-dependent metallopeptidase FtsH/Yme1/Tma family protein [Elusimicrobiota bacterium]